MAVHVFTVQTQFEQIKVLLGMGTLYMTGVLIFPTHSVRPLPNYFGHLLHHTLHVCSGGPRADQSTSDLTSPTSTTSADRKWAPADSGSAEGRGGPNVGIVPDSQQLFVGNLPHNVDDDELVKFFTSESVFTSLLCETFNIT